MVLPEAEVNFDDEADNYSFPVKQTLRLKRVMGYEKHRIARDGASSSDLCVYGLNRLINEKIIDPGEIGAIIAVTITPDYFVPHVSNIIQGRCGLQNDVLCVDISQGCAGFIIGLSHAFMLLEHLGGKKVLLFNADVLSHKVSKRDRNSYPLIGDMATVTLVENSRGARDIFFNIYMDGSRGSALIIPAGGSRLPCSQLTAEMRDDGEGNFRSLDNMKMDGFEVFNFVQREVPRMVGETLGYAGVNKEEVDWYLFHQPNKFMLQKLADSIGVPREKVFMNIVENYGNPSGASIPAVIAHNLSEDIGREKYLCCLAAFGGGLAWGAMVMELGNFGFCETVTSNL
ncbi:3-oxoacyl-[acyl-carrier-protein] synthase 3 [Synergistales bacterium]|nr:3-oxoacyl-[acyl-carrier-protein] synthase 3 [Synergistales bacterium]